MNAASSKYSPYKRKGIENERVDGQEKFPQKEYLLFIYLFDERHEG